MWRIAPPPPSTTCKRAHCRFPIRKTPKITVTHKNTHDRTYSYENSSSLRVTRGLALHSTHECRKRFPAFIFRIAKFSKLRWYYYDAAMLLPLRGVVVRNSGHMRSQTIHTFVHLAGMSHAGISSSLLQLPGFGSWRKQRCVGICCHEKRFSSYRNE